MNSPLIVKNLSKSYGDVLALDSISFELKKGEVFGLLGHNGAGKSTSIECILGVKNYDSGTISLLGENPSKRKAELFERIGVQFQQTGYQEKILVQEICEITSSLYQNPLNWRELLKEFGLIGMEKRVVVELSGGERQKLSVLLALIPNPEFVILDELTTGLDSQARRDVWKILSKLKRNGLTILLTSHYMDEVQALCDRICILKHGKIIILDTVQKIIDSSPYSTLEEAYLWYSNEEEANIESI